MPVKASYWDAWYEACKNDYFAWKDGGYWSLPTYATDAYKGAGAAGTNTAYTSCTKFSDTYKNGKAVAEDMWGGAFTYDRRGQCLRHDLHRRPAEPQQRPLYR